MKYTGNERLFPPFYALLTFWGKKTEKYIKMLKKMFLTSEQCAMHLYAGQNTQYIFYYYVLKRAIRL